MQHPDIRDGEKRDGEVGEHVGEGDPEVHFVDVEAFSVGDAEVPEGLDGDADEYERKYLDEWMSLCAASQ